MHASRSFAILVLLVAGIAFAQQPTIRGSLAAVEVTGTQTYEDIVRTIISAREGTPVDRIDLEAERNRIYSLGTFEEVTVSLEQRAGGPVLLIGVVENPSIGAIAFEGNEAYPDELLAEALLRENLIDEGRVFNTIRAEDALATIRNVYRNPGAGYPTGFPYDVGVSLAVEPADAAAAEGQPVPLRLTYTIDEAEPIDEVAFEGATALEEDELRDIFAPVVQPPTFQIDRYRAAVQAVGERYFELGYRGSGVDVAATTLEDGTLRVELEELAIASIDTTAIGVDADELSLQPGDLFNYDVLLEDVRRLAEGRSGDVRLVPRVGTGGAVRVTFELGPPESAGPITDIDIQGNTVIPDERLREVLTLEPGDTFTSTIAQEDFRRLRELYLEEGWFIPNQPSFNFIDGTYVQRVAELTIEGYQVTFEDGDGGTLPEVITRYLPEPGTVLNLQTLDAGLRRVAQLGVVQPVGRELIPAEGENRVIVNVIVRDLETGVFQPAAQYGTDTGFSAAISYSESNFLGRAHNVSAEITAQTSDIGLLFGGSLRYSVPWLYIDYEDFKEVPTSVSGAIFSSVTSNNALTADGSTRIPYPGAPAGADAEVNVGEYTQRDTGLSFSVGRAVFEATRVRVSGRIAYSQFNLEPPSEECEFDADGDVENGENCALPTELSVRYLPQSGVTSFFNSAVTYDTRDSVEFPRSGVAASASIGVGIGSDYRSPETGRQAIYAYEQVELGIKTYIPLADLAEGIDDRNHVFAVKLNAGHQFGGDYPTSKRFRVGRTNVEQTQIRGYTLEDFNVSKTYAVASLEYRYDFDFETVATQTVIGILFVDAGYASHVPNFDPYGAPIFLGAGVGVQVNIGFGGVVLPALRFDYGFSERNPTGVFSFRVGPVF